MEKIIVIDTLKADAANEGRRIDLSQAAFARLADPHRGLIDVSIRKP
jgi:hypothetical protein